MREERTGVIEDTESDIGIMSDLREGEWRNRNNNGVNKNRRRKRRGRRKWRRNERKRG